MKSIIKKYKDKIAVIDEIEEDLSRNLRLMKKESKPNEDVINDVKSTIRTFLTERRCYVDFIEELKVLSINKES